MLSTLRLDGKAFERRISGSQIVREDVSKTPTNVGADRRRWMQCGVPQVGRRLRGVFVVVAATTDPTLGRTLKRP